MKQYYYAEDKYGNSHEHGSDYYQYSFNHHGGETWGGGCPYVPSQAARAVGSGVGAVGGW